MVRRVGTLFFLIVLILFFSVRPGYAEANPPLQITSVIAQVMPEYDTQDVLVIYAINYSNQSGKDYNGEVRFDVPKGTTNNIVLENSPGSTGNESHIPIKVEDKGEYAELVWTPTQSIKANESYSIHLEYYFNPLPGVGKKEFTYRLIPSADIGQVQVNVYQPLKATEFQMEPAGKLVKKDSEGFNIYNLNPASLKKGQNFGVKISYTKTDPEPSLKPPSATQQASGSTESGSLSSMAVMLPMVGMLGLVILIGIKSFKPRSVDETPIRRHQKSIQSNPVKTPSDKPESSFSQEKRKLRQKLLDGEINEETYREILADIEQDYK